MFRDFHVLDNGENGYLFFPETVAFYCVSADDGKALRNFLLADNPLRSDLRKIISKEEMAAAEMLLPRTHRVDSEIESLCLYMAHDCTLSCTYCYNSGGRSVNAGMMMSPEVAEAALMRFFTKPGKRYAVSFYGGEPLMNFQAIKRVVEIGGVLAGDREIDISYSVTTNGTIMNDEIIDFLDKHFSTVTISIDGPKYINDRHRKAATYSPFEKTMANLNRLLEKSRSVKVTVRGTIAGDCISELESTVSFLSGLGADGFSIAPVNTGKESHAYINDDWYEEYIGRFNGLTVFYFDGLVEGRGVGFKYTLPVVANILTKRKFIKHCDAGRNIAVTADGSLYACHGLTGYDAFCMGNVRDEVKQSFKKMQETFAGLTIYDMEECRQCWARYLCGGSCYAHAYINTGSLYSPEPRHCRLFKKNAEVVIKKFLTTIEDPAKKEKLYRNMHKVINAGKKGEECV